MSTIKNNPDEVINTKELTTVELINPIKRKEGEAIKEITIRRPKTGDLRNLKLLDVMQYDHAAIRILFSRIAQPTITDNEFDNLSIPEFARVSEAISGFFTE